MRIEYVTFQGRDGRADYVAQRFASHLRGRVLDVGCDTRRLRSLVPEMDYTGIDIGGDPDITIDLEACNRLPFDDNAFDCVVCTDVLEHLQNFHAMFAELVRVSRRRLIISLPNCWSSLRTPLFRGRGTVRYYGLPPEPPEDRHKWFFNADDVARFMSHHAGGMHYTVESQYATVNTKLMMRLRRLWNPAGDRYINRFAHSVWTVLRKNESA